MRKRTIVLNLIPVVLLAARVTAAAEDAEVQEQERVDAARPDDKRQLGKPGSVATSSDEFEGSAAAAEQRSHYRAADRERWRKDEEVKRAEYQERIGRNAANPARCTELWRPQYHFTPIEEWMNDPNGLVFFNGKWIMCLQHGGWGLATSDDLFHWQHHDRALMADEMGSIWSGSSVVDRQNVSGFFEDGSPGIVAFFTYKGASPEDQDGQRRGSQAIAYSTDGIHYTKYDEGNPVIPQLRYLEGHPDEIDFRDPKVFWHEPTQRWVMAVAGGKLRIWSSENLKDWRFESVDENIQTECPDLFELPVDGNPADTRWVLSHAGVIYQLGDFDGRRFTLLGIGGQFDFGPSCYLPRDGHHGVYASQTWSDVPDGRRIMINWLRPPEGWLGRPGGGMSLPLELSLRTAPEGIRLFQQPVKEIENLRGQHRSFEEVEIVPGQNLLDGLRGKQLEIAAEFELRDAKRFGFKVLKGRNGDHALVAYDADARELVLDRTRCGWTRIPSFSRIYRVKAEPVENRITMRIFVDSASVEFFANDGREKFTVLVLPQPASDRVELFSEGGSVRLIRLDAYELHSVWRTEEEDGRTEPATLQLWESFDVPVGATRWLSARVAPAGARNTPVSWGIEDESIVSIEKQEGEWVQLLGRKAGETAITARVPGTALASVCKLSCFTEGPKSEE
ncbi:MAG TPA: glycoside hydrolase family 32 protein [Candidatus Hydrogenedentes bacterium]|nr:glycoside hydrolase family 32 protein [Candidatus Hydrogenedentota bacterium]